MNTKLKTAFENNHFTPEQVEKVMAKLDAGELRVAEKRENEWVVNTWVKRAILAYFAQTKVRDVPSEPFVFLDKIPLKTAYGRVRLVPGGTSVRYGSYLSNGVVVMPPSYINIGVYIGSDTMVDSHVLVGSCAQIGANVHLSAGVQIGGVLEPAQASPVIIEKGAFIGAGCMIVEGVQIQENAIVAPGVVVSASTPIIELDAEGNEKMRYRDKIPANAIVIPGVRPKGKFAYQTPLLIGYRNEKTDAKVALNNSLRDF